MFFFETGTHYLVQAGLIPTLIRLPQPSKCWEYSHVPSCLVTFYFSELNYFLIGTPELIQEAWVDRYMQSNDHCLVRERIFLFSIGWIKTVNIPIFDTISDTVMKYMSIFMHIACYFHCKNISSWYGWIKIYDHLKHFSFQKPFRWGFQKLLTHPAKLIPKNVVPNCIPTCSRGEYLLSTLISGRPRWLLSWRFSDA